MNGSALGPRAASDIEIGRDVGDVIRLRAAECKKGVGAGVLPSCNCLTAMDLTREVLDVVEADDCQCGLDRVPALLVLLELEIGQPGRFDGDHFAAVCARALEQRWGCLRKHE